MPAHWFVSYRCKQSVYEKFYGDDERKGHTHQKREVDPASGSAMRMAAAVAIFDAGDERTMSKNPFAQNSGAPSRQTSGPVRLTGTGNSGPKTYSTK
jgi:hypothetical protein